MNPRLQLLKMPSSPMVDRKLWICKSLMAQLKQLMPDQLRSQLELHLFPNVSTST